MYTCWKSTVTETVVLLDTNVTASPWNECIQWRLLAVQRAQAGSQHQLVKGKAPGEGNIRGCSDTAKPLRGRVVPPNGHTANFSVVLRSTTSTACHTHGAHSEGTPLAWRFVSFSLHSGVARWLRSYVISYVIYYVILPRTHPDTQKQPSPHVCLAVSKLVQTIRNNH